MNAPMKKISGFSLAELLVILCILGLFVSMAYSGYQHSLQQSRRADFRTSLIQDQLLLEQCFFKQFSYLKDCKERPAFPHHSISGFYSIQLSKVTDSTYTLVAVPRTIQKNDSQCVLMTINELNLKQAFNASDRPEKKCWY